MNASCYCPLCRCTCKDGCTKCRDWLFGQKVSIEEMVEFDKLGMLPQFSIPRHLLPGAQEFFEMRDVGLLPLNAVIVDGRWGDE